MANEPSLEPWTFLERARIRAGYGRPIDAARAIGIGISHYCSVEKGRRRLGGDKIVKAARLFNVDVFELKASAPEIPVRRPESDDIPAVAS